MLQVFFGTTVLLIGNGTLYYFVNYKEDFGYSNNTFSFITFKVWFGLIMVHGIISYLSLVELDVLELFNLQEYYPNDKAADGGVSEDSESTSSAKKDRKCRLVLKVVLSLGISAVILMLPIAAMYISRLNKLSNIFIIQKSEQEGNITLSLTKANLLNTNTSYIEQAEMLKWSKTLGM